MTDLTEYDTEAGVVAALAQLAAATPAPLEVGDFYSLVRPAGTHHEILDLERFLPAPRAKRGTATLHDARSFADYVLKHHAGDPTRNDATEMYADVQAATVVAVLDGHSTAGPGWGQHRARLTLRTTPAWQRWTARNNAIGSQVEFAEHIEACLPDIVNPPGAELLELAQSFQARQKVNFESAQFLANGQRQLSYVEELDATAGRKGNIVIPATFELGIVPYEGSDPYKVIAHLRYRIRDGRLNIGYVLERPEDVLRAAFDEVLGRIENETGRVALRGQPPS